MGAKIFEILTYFIIYSFLGWIMESIVRSVSEKKIINTGFLKGPVCPIYGIGAIIMLLFLERYQNKPILLFFIAIIVLTTWEYLVGVLLEKIFHTKYWDYSEQKFNFQGRICLVNSICWGILGVLFVKYIHPFVEKELQFVNPTILKIVIALVPATILAVAFALISWQEISSVGMILFWAELTMVIYNAIIFAIQLFEIERKK